MHQYKHFYFSTGEKQQSPVLDIQSSINQRDTVCNMCFSSSLDHQPNQRLNIPWTKIVKYYYHPQLVEQIQEEIKLEIMT